jgi:hypothetical protein
MLAHSRQIDRGMDEQTERCTDRRRIEHRGKETKRQRDKETKRQRDKETKRQRDKETKRQRDKETKRLIIPVQIASHCEIGPQNQTCK